MLGLAEEGGEAELFAEAGWLLHHPRPSAGLRLLSGLREALEIERESGPAGAAHHAHHTLLLLIALIFVLAFTGAGEINLWRGWRGIANETFAAVYIIHADFPPTLDWGYSAFVVFSSLNGHACTQKSPIKLASSTASGRGKNRNICAWGAGGDLKHGRPPSEQVALQGRSEIQKAEEKIK